MSFLLGRAYNLRDIVTLDQTDFGIYRVKGRQAFRVWLGNCDDSDTVLESTNDWENTMPTTEFNFNVDELTRAVLQAGAEEVIKKVQSVSCQEHGKYAHIVVTGTNANDITFAVSGCCDKLVQKVKRELEGN